MKSKMQLQDEAIVRQAAHSKLTLEQKIAQCKSRRGESKRELRRLTAQVK